MTTEPYELFYWPGIQGRGEFVRLALEDAGVTYIDVARTPEKEGGGVPALMKLMRDAPGAVAPFAPPFLKVGAFVLAQTACVLDWVARHHGLVPNDEASRAHAMQLQLTLADLVVEAHDTHHPIASSLYYDDQRTEAARRAPLFRHHRLPKYLGWLERTLSRGPGPYVFGGECSYADLSMFQTVAGLEYAFPNAMLALRSNHPKLHALRDRVAARPRIAAYLSSARRLPFNEKGIFRHYSELDAEPVSR